MRSARLRSGSGVSRTYRAQEEVSRALLDILEHRPGVATYIFHHPHSLLCLAYEFVLSLLDPLPFFFSVVGFVSTRRLRAGLGRIELQPCILYIPTRFRSEI